MGIVCDVNEAIRKRLKANAISMLRVAIAIVFIWFGMLKIFWLSPANKLVADTVFWFDPSWFIPFLGWWEVAIGICFLFPKLVRYGLVLLLPQMAGTFLPLVILPARTFQGNVFLPTMEGQYIIKNLVLLSAALVVAVYTQPIDKKKTEKTAKNAKSKHHIRQKRSSLTRQVGSAGRAKRASP